VTIVLSRGADVPLYQTAAPVIGKVEKDSPAAKAGLKPGDRIIQIGDREVSTWDALDMAVMPQAKHELNIVAMRDGAPVQARITPDAVSKFEVGDLGIWPVMRPELLSVDPSGAAARAGLRRGDVVLAVNGTRLEETEVVDEIRKHGGMPITLTIERDGMARDVSVVPEKRGGTGVIGVSISAFEVRRVDPNLLQAMKMSVRRNWENTMMIGATIRGLVRGNTPVRQLMGPVAIAQLSGNAAQLGWIPLFELMAMVSLNLGLINLLPIPVMDGGQIAILGFESLTRRDLSIKVKERILLAGAALIVTLMATVIYNDVMRLLK
jgi:regulator of sigma E protease